MFSVAQSERYINGLATNHTHKQYRNNTVREAEST